MLVLSFAMSQFQVPAKFIGENKLFPYGADCKAVLSSIFDFKWSTYVTFHYELRKPQGNRQCNQRKHQPAAEG